MRFLGIPVRFNISAIVLGIIGSSIASRIAPNTSFAIYLFLGAAVSILFILSILWHERGHIFAAAKFGIGARGILIFGLGGIAFLEGPNRNAREAFWIAISGPIASVIAAAGFYGGYALADAMLPDGALFGQILLNLGFINLFFGIFNLIPVFPFDGGRIAYSALWATTRDEVRARRLCIRISRIIMLSAFAFILIPAVLNGTLFLGSLIWYALIALLLWKMQNAALDQPLAIPIPAP